MTLPLLELRDLVYGTGSGRDLYLDVLRPDVPLLPPRPAVLWVHGGGWREGSRSPSPSWMLAERGFVTASTSYRFSEVAAFPAQIHDVKAAIRFLRANAGLFGIDPERIGIWGGSAGGHLAALAAVSEGVSGLEGEGGNANESSAVQAAVAISPPTDFLVDWWQDSAYPEHEVVTDVVAGLFGDEPDERRDLARLASPMHLAHGGVPPVLVVHGTLDDMVPISQGRRLVESLTAHGVEASLLELPQDDHSVQSVFSASPGHPTEASREIVAFFERVLGPVGA